MSSTRKTSERPSPAYNLSGTEAATAATPTEAAEAATEAAEAVIEAAAAEVAEAAEAALRFGGGLRRLRRLLGVALLNRSDSWPLAFEVSL